MPIYDCTPTKTGNSGSGATYTTGDDINIVDDEISAKISTDIGNKLPFGADGVHLEKELHMPQKNIMKQQAIIKWQILKHLTNVYPLDSVDGEYDVTVTAAGYEEFIQRVTADSDHIVQASLTPTGI